VANQTTSWKPDPYGAHELRFFSADGKPTLLVMDGGKTSYDRPPTSQPVAAPEPPSSPEPEPDPAPTPVTPPALDPQPTAVDAGRRATRSAPQATDANTEEAAARDLPRAPVPEVADFADGVSAPVVDRRSQETLSRPLKIAYGVVFVALALSVLGLAYVHLRPTGGRPSTHAEGAATTSTSSASRTTTTIALPTALKSGAEAAATALVSSWSTGNKPAALTVATSAAVATLFSVPYASGLAVNRGCSTSFSPIVCTFGPPGGASPTDSIYQIMVSQVAGGWYVNSVRIEH
jgi:hypothetical protein